MTRQEALEVLYHCDRLQESVDKLRAEAEKVIHSPSLGGVVFHYEGGEIKIVDRTRL